MTMMKALETEGDTRTHKLKQTKPHTTSHSLQPHSSDNSRGQDEKKEDTESSYWLANNTRKMTDKNGRQPKARLSDTEVAHSLLSTSSSASVHTQPQIQQRNQRPTTTVHTSISSASGLHHRHHFHAATNNTYNQQSSLPHTSSPNRRRRTRKAMGMGAEQLHQNRKRKWTVAHICRRLSFAGVAGYMLFLFRSTQILMRNANDDNSNSNNNNNHGGHRLADLISLQHPAMAGYLRSGHVLSIEDLGLPFVHQPNRQERTLVKQAVKQRLIDRQKRTRPPSKQLQQHQTIEDYDIISPGHRVQRQFNHQSPPMLANRTQLCGLQAQIAREKNPASFLREDSLHNNNAQVLITGIVSNPLAFHLALTLIDKCGVEVLVGVDPMLPNTIRHRMQHVEKMKILASNAPRMVQPILVPLLGLDPRVKKTKKGEPPEHPLMLETTGEINLLNFRPTHIVHLSAATYQNPAAADFEPSPFAPKRPLTSYQLSEDDPYTPSLFHIRSSMTAMEQILASTVEGSGAPHVTYASATMTTDHEVSFSSDDKVLYYSKLGDEVLAATYSSLFGTSSVGIRFPPHSVYGPWGEQDSDWFKLFDRASRGNHSSFAGQLDMRQFVYVQDAAEAIIAGMQYRTNEATTLDLSAASADSLSSIATMTESFMSKDAPQLPPSALHVQGRKEETLQWEPRTTLRDGVLKTLAWHLDRTNPYGPPVHGSGSTTTKWPQLSSSPVVTTGDSLLQKHSVSTCDANDLACHAGSSFVPCASECSTRAQCIPSIFDSVRELTRDMTEGCDAVLYTQSLGLDIEDLQLQSQYEDDVEPAICNLAFVAGDSPLVSAVIDKIPKSELARLGVAGKSSDLEKRQQLNGRLLYRGWILIWVEPQDSISQADASLMKLSPGRMFSKDVMYVVFVEENFTVSPTMDDVRFLISQMDRGATKQRNVYRMFKKDDESKPTKVKFVVAAQPEKRAAILVSQLKFKISERGRIPQDTKINVLDAVRFMRFEIGSDPTRQKESAAIRRQKEFYRRIPTFVNGKDLRDNDEPLYRYEMKHWVRTRWVVHDLTLEESRELRCDWYQEHLQWESEVDQLSFAAVMANRIIERRMLLKERDDRSKSSKSTDPPELRDITDNNEWFPLASEHTLDDRDAASQQQQAPDEEGAEEEGGANEDGPEVSSGNTDLSRQRKHDIGLYVRVISDRIMSLSRKMWSRYRAELLLEKERKRGD